ncbi:MAG: hypothetical protein MR598_08320 [Erysipelotrichaceae bacterium]|nr:hypothetical protein [Erysipelotrichaceae bacterium]
MIEKDSSFYRKFKQELSLSNPTVTYMKHKKRLLSGDENKDKKENDSVKKLVRKK